MKPKVLIIGAGPGGLTVANELKNYGIEFEIVDKSDTVGGIWNINREDSPIYNSTHFISSKTLSGFSSHPMPDHYPDYPSHKKIYQYILDYANTNELTNLVKLNTGVTRIENNNNTWEVSFDNGKTTEYSDVISAIGLTMYTHMPNGIDNYKGEFIHSKDYFSPEVFKDKKILIIGAGNSGCDIACDAAQFASETSLSLRRGYYFLPKYIMGMPADVYGSKNNLPDVIYKPMQEFLLNNFLVGKPSKYGLPDPDHRVLESHPIMNTQLLHHLGHGDVQIKPDIETYNANSITFKDGKEETFDLIVFATGYQRVYPFLESINPIYNDPNERIDLHLEIFDRDHDNLMIMGGLELAGGAYPVLERQARLIGKYLSEKHKGSSAYNKFKDELKSKNINVKGKKKYINSQRHKYYVDMSLYHKLLEKQIKELG